MGDIHPSSGLTEAGTEMTGLGLDGWQRRQRERGGEGKGKCGGDSAWANGGQVVPFTTKGKPGTGAGRKGGRKSKTLVCEDV